MKIIFLDIDGVLNSDIYDRERGYYDGNIDKSRLVLVKRLVDKTGAKIVLSSSWREHWEKDIDAMSDIGKEIASVFEEAGLFIYDKTPVLGSRKNEILEWLSGHDDISAFVIIDDALFGWEELGEYLVRTDKKIGRGIEEIHIEKAEKILGT